MKQNFNLKEADEKFCKAITLLVEVKQLIGKEKPWLQDELVEFDSIISELENCELSKECNFG